MTRQIATLGLTRAYGEELERAIELTVPGMADFADPRSEHKCASCLHWRKQNAKLGTCGLFTRRMRGRRIQLNSSQTACRQWEVREKKE